MLLIRLSKIGTDIKKDFIDICSPYFLRKEFGGKFNTWISFDLQMPNCTFGATHMAWEATETEEKFQVGGPDVNWDYLAKLYWENSPLEHTDDPVCPCIVVFDGNSGHVGIAWERNKDGTYLYTDSSYNANKDLRDDKYYFRVIKNQRLVKGERVMSGVGAIKGFLTIPVKNDIRTVRDNSKDQIEIRDLYHEVIVKPTTSARPFRYGCYAPRGIYDVQEIAQADGYTWVRVEVDHWIAITGDMTFYKKKVDVDYEKLYQEANDKLIKIKEIIEGKAN